MTTATAHRPSAARWLLVALAALALVASALAAQDAPLTPAGYDAGMAAGPDLDPDAGAPADGSYGYFRIVEGGATVTSASGERAAAEINQPLLAGDRVAVQRGARLEIVLPDHNLLRLDGGTEVALDALAGSADSRDGETRIHLVQGNLQLVVDAGALGDRLPRIDTENASVYVDAPGTYRVTANASDWTALVVRRGAADVATGRGAMIVRAGEEAVAQGTRDALAEVRAAGAWDPLERWGRQLVDQLAELPPVNQEIDPDLRYSASSLAQYGSWIEVDGSDYWQPRVDNGWRPFWHGRWVSTPSGLTWVAYEPWGWVPYHYGTWDYLPAHGWAWSPGRVYSPAWVYWYWGPSLAGWCPVGYYTRFYGRRFAGLGFHHGVYGWAGGDWDSFARWSFVGAGRFGRRDLDRFAFAGDRLRDEGRLAELPRGIITTDTRRVTPAHWNDPRAVVGILASGPRPLPDVTPFVARNPRLPTDVVHAVVTAGPGTGRPLPAPPRPGILAPQPTAAGRPPRAFPGNPAGGPAHDPAGYPIARGRIVAPARPPFSAGPRLDPGDRGDQSVGRSFGSNVGREISIGSVGRSGRADVVAPPSPPRTPATALGRPQPERGGVLPWRGERPRLVAPREQVDERPLRAAPAAGGILRPEARRTDPAPQALAPREIARPVPGYERPALPAAPAIVRLPALPPAVRQPAPVPPAARQAPPAIQRPPAERPERPQEVRPHPR